LASFCTICWTLDASHLIPLPKLGSFCTIAPAARRRQAAGQASRPESGPVCNPQSRNWLRFAHFALRARPAPPNWVRFVRFAAELALFYTSDFTPQTSNLPQLALFFRSLSGVRFIVTLSPPSTCPSCDCRRIGFVLHDCSSAPRGLGVPPDILPEANWLCFARLPVGTPISRSASGRETEMTLSRAETQGRRGRKGFDLAFLCAPASPREQRSQLTVGHPPPNAGDAAYMVQHPFTDVKMQPK